MMRPVESLAIHHLYEPFTVIVYTKKLATEDQFL